MKYIVEIDGAEREVRVDGERVVTDAGGVDARLVRGVGPVQMLRIGDRVHRLIARQGGERGDYTIWVDGHRVEVRALDERARAIRALSAVSAAASGPAPLVAPMPGLIVRVSVAPGDRVEAGQGLVVMEAMKMENELRTRSAGTVRVVRVTPGVAVEKGAILVELE
jgi:biotin carboxyl carrier protein